VIVRACGTGIIATESTTVSVFSVAVAWRRGLRRSALYALRPWWTIGLSWAGVGADNNDLGLTLTQRQ